MFTDGSRSRGTADIPPYYISALPAGFFIQQMKILRQGTPHIYGIHKLLVKTAGDHARKFRRIFSYSRHPLRNKFIVASIWFIKPEHVCVLKPSLFAQMLNVLPQILLHYPFIARIVTLHSAYLRFSALMLVSTAQSIRRDFNGIAVILIDDHPHLKIEFREININRHLIYMIGIDQFNLGSKELSPIKWSNMIFRKRLDVIFPDAKSVLPGFRFMVLIKCGRRNAECGLQGHAIGQFKPEHLHLKRHRGASSVGNDGQLSRINALRRTFRHLDRNPHRLVLICLDRQRSSFLRQQRIREKS